MSQEPPTPPQKRLFMVIEHFKDRDPLPIYRRFREAGRMHPDGLDYISSWIDDRFERCYQLMQTHDRSLLDQWIAKWADLIEFEVYPVVTSKEAVDLLTPNL